MKGYMITVGIRDGSAFIWLKTLSGEVVKITRSYKPDLYVKPTRMNLSEIWNLLERSPHIHKLNLELKKVNFNSKRKIKVIHARAEGEESYRIILRRLSAHSCKLYNYDLAHRQKLMFELKVPCLNPIEYDEPSGEFKAINDDLNLEPPPISHLKLDLEVACEGWNPNPKRDPIKRIILQAENDPIVLEGSESEILTELEKAINEFDPDFIITPKIAAKYISWRAKINQLNLNLGRDSAGSNLGASYEGRAIINPTHYEEYGLAGIAELCNYSMLPPDLAVSWPVGKLVDSRQCYEAIKRNVLLPPARNPNTNFRLLSQFHQADHGGLTLNPKPGVYENVCQLDFDSQYPNIIVNYNISYETVLDTGKVLSKPRGFLAEITEYWLKRRLHFKRQAKMLPPGKLKTYAEQRQKALKSVLVVVYGYSGCPWNRFGNVKCFEEINRISRKILVKALNIAEELGFEVIYADVDSIYVHKPNANLSDYEHLRSEIASQTGLPISIENWFKFIAFPPQKSNPSLPAVKRYFGKLMNGEIVFKGIEAKRHDQPKLIREVQLKMIEELFKAQSIREVKGNIERAMKVLANAVKALSEGKISAEKLVIHRMLHKHPLKYRSKFPHVIAALQLIQRGASIKPRMPVSYIITKAKSKNPYLKVNAVDPAKGKYDPEKYIEILISAAETILSPLKISKVQIINYLQQLTPLIKTRNYALA